MTGRRGNNEGSIRQRADGLYEARITLADGKRKSVYGKTRPEVVKQMQELLHDVSHGIPVLDDRQTVKQYLEGWYASAEAQIRPSSYRRYGDYIRVHLVPGLGHIQLSKLTPQQVQLFYTQKTQSGLSSTTVRSMHSVLHRALDDAVGLDIIARNVTDKVRAPRRFTKEMQTLSVPEVQRFLSVIKGDRFEALYILALSTGMREGELLGLRWQDVDLAARSLSVRMNVQETPTVYILAEVKTTYSRRNIALTQAAVDALAAHWQAQQFERARMKEKYDPALDLVFSNGFGGIMIPHNITKRGFKKHLVKAGLSRDIRFHDLRHTAATLLLAAGVNVKVVSEMLGHSSISITLSIYAHILPHMQQAAVTAMESLFVSSEPRKIEAIVPQLG